jgi:hypothetical protein
MSRVGGWGSATPRTPRPCRVYLSVTSRASGWLSPPEAGRSPREQPPVVMTRQLVATIIKADVCRH